MIFDQSLFHSDACRGISYAKYYGSELGMAARGENEKGGMKVRSRKLEGIGDN